MRQECNPHSLQVPMARALLTPSSHSLQCLAQLQNQVYSCQELCVTQNCRDLRGCKLRSVIPLVPLAFLKTNNPTTHETHVRLFRRRWENTHPKQTVSDRYKVDGFGVDGLEGGFLSWYLVASQLTRMTGSLSCNQRQNLCTSSHRLSYKCGAITRNGF